MTRARRQLVLTGAARRRVFGEYQNCEPSRFLDEVPAHLMDRIAPEAELTLRRQLRAQPLRVPHQPYGRKGSAHFKEKEATYAYEHEDQSATDVRAGMRVRHAQFGVGSVIAVEQHNDDMKITVRFISVGVKKLLAKYARLEPA